MRGSSFFRDQEARYEKQVPASEWIILRLDGRGFTKLTEKSFEKPFDLNFHTQMCTVALQLMDDLQAIYCYTASDEISLLFPVPYDQYNRRVEKLVSISAAIASSWWSSYGFPAQFDSRLLSFAREELVLDYFDYRRDEVERCAVMTRLYWTLRKEGKTPRVIDRLVSRLSQYEQEQLLLSYTPGVFLPWQRHGVHLYWQQYTKEGYDPIQQRTVSAERRKIMIEDLPSGVLGYRELLEQIMQ